MENIVLFYFECRDNFALNQITIDMRVYLWTLFYSTGRFVCLLANISKGH